MIKTKSEALEKIRRYKFMVLEEMLSKLLESQRDKFDRIFHPVSKLTDTRFSHALGLVERTLKSNERLGISTPSVPLDENTPIYTATEVTAKLRELRESAAQMAWNMGVDIQRGSQAQEPREVGGMLAKAIREIPIGG